MSLTIALAKGRLADEAMKILGEVGVFCSEMNEKSRKLIFISDDGQYKFFLAKPGDVPTYVEYGAADIGIVGGDVLMEEKRSLCEALDLGFGKCRMVLAGPPAIAKESMPNNLRVATKYPVITADYFYRSRRRTVEIIKLNGSVELGCAAGLSDVIVDIVETGSTLKENGLCVIDEIAPISARLVVNRVSMKMDCEKINGLIRDIRGVMKGRNRC